MNKKLYIVGPHNCPARRNRICIMNENEEECHMLVGVECMFFDYELQEKIRQLRLQKQNNPQRKWFLSDPGIGG